MEFVTNKRFLIGCVVGAVAWHFAGSYVLGMLPGNKGSQDPSAPMKVMGLWVLLVGYTIVWAGLSNWSGNQTTLPEAFVGQQAAPTDNPPPTPPNTPQTIPPESMAGWNGNQPAATIGAQPE